ncbi:MAG TPA: SDR family NAD(P)-dependent oxidoreductase [Gemmatimonadaceae bacterium]
MATVLITGVGREGQVGEAVAAAFAGRGDVVLLVDRAAEQVEARALGLRDAGHMAHGYACDLTDEAQVAALVGHVVSHHGASLDALVNLAGGWVGGGSVAATELAVWDRLFAINVRTALVTTRAFLPALRAARGAIVCFASEAVLPGADVAGMAAYAASKQGVATLVSALASEERAHGVRANAVAPASIRTRDNLAAMSAGERYVEREDVAAAVLWLCSPAAAAVTGQVIRLAP